MAKRRSHLGTEATELLTLPQKKIVWQIEAAPLHNWIAIAGRRARLWIVLVTSPGADLVLGHNSLEKQPTAAEVWEVLTRSMRRPSAGKPHRPTEVQARPSSVWDKLRPRLADIGVALTVVEQVEHAARIFDGMSEHLAGKPLPGLLDAPGVTPEQAASAFEAAAFFYKQAAWKTVSDEIAIKVECNRFRSGPWYAVVMGNARITIGLALYEDLDVLRGVWKSEGSGEEFARPGVATSP